MRDELNGRVLSEQTLKELLVSSRRVFPFQLDKTSEISSKPNKFVVVYFAFTIVDVVVVVFAKLHCILNVNGELSFKESNSFWTRSVHVFANCNRVFICLFIYSFVCLFVYLPARSLAFSFNCSAACESLVCQQFKLDSSPSSRLPTRASLAQIGARTTEPADQYLPTAKAGLKDPARQLRNTTQAKAPFNLRGTNLVEKQPNKRFSSLSLSN